MNEGGEWEFTAKTRSAGSKSFYRGGAETQRGWDSKKPPRLRASAVKQSPPRLQGVRGNLQGVWLDHRKDAKRGEKELLPQRRRDAEEKG
jgi:hypothetical protein